VITSQGAVGEELSGPAATIPVMTIDQHAGAGTAGPSPEFAKLPGTERTSGVGPGPLAEASERSAGQLGAAIVGHWNAQPGEPR
jgi:hypothetical protein